MRSAIGWLLILGLGAAGCGGGRHTGGGVVAPAAKTASSLTLEELVAGKRDCLQYPVGKFADGSEDWNSDWIYFTLVRSSDGKLVRDAKGQPVAASLLFSQAERFMKEHPETAGTSWCYTVKRTKRHVRNGQVLSQSEYVTLNDVDLEELLAKDKAARAE